MKKTIIIPVAILLVAAVTAVAWFRRDPGEDNRIHLSGNIELTEVHVAFKAPGRVIELNVDEGDTVKKGQVLARLDSDTLLRQKDREQAGVDSARTMLAQSETAVRYQREAIERDIEIRRADIAQAEAHLRELETGSRSQEKVQAQANVEEIRAQAEQAKADLARAETLIKNEDISKQQYDQFRTRAAQTQAALRQAEQRQSLVQEGPRQETIATARAQLDRARAALKLSEAQRIDVERRLQETATRRAELERARANVSVLETQLDDTTAAAPLDGVVLIRSVDRGEVVAAGTNILSIGDIEHPWVRGYVSETQLGRIKLGDAVTIKTDSFPGKTYQGKITFISSEAEFTPKQIQTPEERVKLVYRIKVEVANPQHELKQNMPVDGIIELAH